MQDLWSLKTPEQAVIIWQAQGVGWGVKVKLRDYSDIQFGHILIS